MQPLPLARDIIKAISLLVCMVITIEEVSSRVGLAVGEQDVVERHTADLAPTPLSLMVLALGVIVSVAAKGTFLIIPSSLSVLAEIR